MRQYYIMLGASLAFSIGLQIGLSFLGVPWMVSMGIVLALFMIFPIIIRRRYMSRMRGYGGSDSGVGGGFFGMGQGMNQNSVRYVCLVCNHRYKGGSCPRCGSKMKRADF